MSPTGGRITSGLKPNTFQIQIIDFVLKMLSLWRNDPERNEEQSENRLNLQLCKFLESSARQQFPMVQFNHEEYQQRHSAVDISSSVINVKGYSKYAPVLVFECKRLPAPSKEREKEYVTGGKSNHTGGIQRFKLGIHGATMNIMAMIGYVQRGELVEWKTKINNWISSIAKSKEQDDCVWYNNEHLKKCKSGKIVQSCQSTHTRQKGKTRDKIFIYHLWVDMKKK